MPRSRPGQKDFNAQAAAYLFAEHELSQETIGRMLGGLSQSAVSRLLKYAEKRGWLERRYRFLEAGLPAGRLEYLKSFVKPDRLMGRLSAVNPSNGVRV